VAALFGDSTPNNARSRYYARKQACITLGLATGPLIAVIIFLLLSDTWTQPELTVVMTASAVLGVAVSVVMLSFRERARASPADPVESHINTTGQHGRSSAYAEALLDDALRPAQPAEQHSEPLAEPTAQSTHSPPPPPQPPPPPPLPPLPLHPGTPAVNAARDALLGDRVIEPAWGWSRCCGLRARHVPHLIALSNLLQGLGSGIAYKFVPIFCWKELGLRPVATYAIVAGFQMAATLLNFVVRRLASALGPMGAVTVFMSGGCTALAIVIWCYSTPVVVVALLVRGSLMNSIAGTLGATLNDHVGKANRAKWNVVQQFGMATWSGSAFAGGALSDLYGYRHAFLFTLGFHVLATLALLPAIPLVPPEHRRAANK